MELHELPEYIRSFLVEAENGECWRVVPRVQKRAPRPVVDGKPGNLKKVLWRLAGMSSTGALKLFARCGDSLCFRPEHQEPSVRGTKPGAKARHSRNRRERLRRLSFNDRIALRTAVRALEARGFLPHTVDHNLPIQTYRIGLGMGRFGRKSQIDGPWILYWQEPYREGTKAAAQARRAA